ncbi:MAG TPA: hypothetical protein VM735_13535 [Candidatus Kapabacteria bacterium]|nr:hypothetical protein [Candidatus Kapabacteria bacterium]
MRKALTLLAAVFLFTGCSATFNREYKAATAQPIPTTDISGPWEGNWLSDKNGHTGKLRAVFRQTGANEYDAYFHATFWKIFRASYRVPLKADEKGGRVSLSGEQNLGRLSGGVYTYEGEATPATFFCTYKSKYDHGTFEMKRPAVDE